MVVLIVIKNQGEKRVNRILSELEFLIHNKKHYSALFLSLSLIDVCAKIEYPNAKTVKKPFSNAYTQWIDTYYIPLYEHNPKDPIITSKDMYTLRCKVVHEGTTFLSNEDCTRIIFTQGQSHRNIAGVSDGKTMIIEKQLNIDRFLQEIFLAIQNWSTTKKSQQLSLDFEIISGLFSTTSLNGSQVFCNCD